MSTEEMPVTVKSTPPSTNVKKVGHVDENGVLWNLATTPGEFVGPPEGQSNLYDVIKARAEKSPSLTGFGFREKLTREMIDGFEKLTLGPPQFIKYSEYFSQVEALGAGLASATGLKKGDRLVIYAETQLEWMMAAFAAWRQGLTVVTIYATLGAEGVKYGINQVKAKAVVADGKLLKVLSTVLSDCPSLQHVVTISPEKQVLEGVSVTSIAECISAGTKAPAPAEKADVKDIAVIMYTSGTTGNPKGVKLSHSAVLSCMNATFLPSGSILGSPKWFKMPVPGSMYLAYLPLAHIMEMMVEISLVNEGCTVGYGSPHTLLPTSIKMKETSPPQIGDAAAFAPTIMVFAPAVLDKVYGGVNSKITAAGGLKLKLFNMALASGKRKYEQGGMGPGGLWGIIFKRVRKALGGQCQLFLCGSAPLSPDVQMWVQSVFGAPCRQGYGLTETCAATTIAPTSDNATANVGPPTAGCCIRLRDWEEGNYKNADVDDPEIGMRRGEVLIGGPTVTDGYFVDEASPDPEVVQKNAEDFVTIDGIRYFCTGDIGQITPAGALAIIDRKKDLVKLQNGEYVALSKVENVLKVSPYCELPMVYADSKLSYVVMLVCPREPKLRELAGSLSVPDAQTASLESLCGDESVVAAVLKDLQRCCKEKKLATFETPQKLILISELWTPENDLLTAAMKLKRKPIVAKHQAQIMQIYV